ncbi:MAG: 1-deoxy-D-xylulose-5-phosphate reductoisomerase [Eubacteriales bacterium]|nr:1-deoxy-D-xylulose-5-phosphate reductoisomerase [Eubacteriales bacterium]
MYREIIVLGSTGSIGRQTLELCAFHGIRVRGLAAERNWQTLSEDVDRFQVEAVALVDDEAASQLRARHPKLKIFTGPNSARELVEALDSSPCLNAISGMAGLDASVTCLQAGRDLLLANKESIVAAGSFLKQLSNCYGGKIIPLDSEHSAIWQCLRSYSFSAIHKIFLTCSGGPFRGYSREQLAGVRASDALRHPTWSMGDKITIDSATLMNKGLELIEACHLFDLDEEQVEVVVHPESVLHSAVLFEDGACLGQFGRADMRVPIQYALMEAERARGPMKAFSFLDAPTWHFEAVDDLAFPAISWARRAQNSGGYASLVLNSVNEVCNCAFREGRISFLDFEKLIPACLDLYILRESKKTFEYNVAKSLDLEYRSRAKELIQAL